MKNYDIDRILEPSFKLFLENNYESVSTPKLELATGLTRGAIFYKHKTKQALFCAVIDRYILNFLSGNNEVETSSLREFIDRFLENVCQRMSEMHSLGISNIHRCYFNLMYQALKYYPDFDSKITEMFNVSLSLWTKAVQQAKDSGEIKPSYSAAEVAQQFKFLYTGMSFEHSLSAGLDINQLREAYNSLYNEIKL